MPTPIIEAVKKYKEELTKPSELVIQTVTWNMEDFVLGKPLSTRVVDYISSYVDRKLEEYAAIMGSLPAVRTPTEHLDFDTDDHVAHSRQEDSFIRFNTTERPDENTAPYVDAQIGDEVTCEEITIEDDSQRALEGSVQQARLGNVPAGIIYPDGTVDAPEVEDAEEESEEGDVPGPSNSLNMVMGQPTPEVTVHHVKRIPDSTLEGFSAEYDRDVKVANHVERDPDTQRETFGARYFENDEPEKEEYDGLTQNLAALKMGTESPINCSLDMRTGPIDNSILDEFNRHPMGTDRPRTIEADATDPVRYAETPPTDEYVDIDTDMLSYTTGVTQQSPNRVRDVFHRPPPANDGLMRLRVSQRIISAQTSQRLQETDHTLHVRRPDLREVGPSILRTQELKEVNNDPMRPIQIKPLHVGTNPFLTPFNSSTLRDTTSYITSYDIDHRTRQIKARILTAPSIKKIDHTTWFDLCDANGTRAPKDIKDVIRNTVRANLTILVGERPYRNLRADTEAERTAQDTLRELITEEEFRRYMKHGFILIRGLSGDVYQVFRDQHHTKVWRKGQVVEEVCIRLSGDAKAPPTDNVIAFMTMISADEYAFKRAGNLYKMKAA